MLHAELLKQLVEERVTDNYLRDQLLELIRLAVQSAEEPDNEIVTDELIEFLS